jgi:ribosomal protein S18 acetylase RimI-like enzyme
MSEIENKTMENTVIRKAEEKDIPEILRLLVQVNMVHHNIRPDLFKGPATKYTPDQLKQIMNDPDTPIFVCTSDKGTFYGYIFCELERMEESNLHTGIKTLYIDDLCVDECARGHHVGSKLYHYTLDYAKKIGCYNVTLHVWGGNDKAEKFYKDMGMKTQFTCMETIL